MMDFYSMGPVEFFSWYCGQCVTYRMKSLSNHEVWAENVEVQCFFSRFSISSFIFSLLSFADINHRLLQLCFTERLVVESSRML
jgi:hypothetical protein